MTDSELIDGEIVELPTQKDVYILMVRFGGSLWSASMVYDSMEDLQTVFSQRHLADTDGTYRIVKVKLPIEGPSGGDQE